MNNAGLPGFGLGGLFYMCSAVLMFCREVYRACRGRKTEWSTVLPLISITALTLLALYGTYALLDIFLRAVHVGGVLTVIYKSREHFTPLVWSLGILAVLMSVVWVTGFIQQRLHKPVVPSDS